MIGIDETIPTIPNGDDPGLLTPAEHRAVYIAGWLARQIETIADDDPTTRGNDIRKLQDKLHDIQQYILAQAAARAYPTLYRLLGGPIVNPGVTTPHPTVNDPRKTTP